MHRNSPPTPLSDRSGSEAQPLFSRDACMVIAPEVENLVCDGVRRQLVAMGRTEPAAGLADRELIERHVSRVIVTPRALKVCFNPASEASAQVDDQTLDNTAACHPL